MSQEPANITPTSDAPATEATPRPGFSNNDTPCEKCGYIIRNTRAVRCPECGFVIPKVINDDVVKDAEKSKVALWSRFHFWLCVIACVGVGCVFVFFSRMHAISLIRAVVVSLLFLAPILNIISWRRTRPRCFKWSKLVMIFVGLANCAFSVLIIWMTVRLVYLS